MDENNLKRRLKRSLKRNPHLSSVTNPPTTTEVAKAAGLIYGDDSRPGIKRLKRGKGFRFLDVNEKILTNQKQLRRIKHLVIPPAWTEVWISPQETSHIQATGRDARGRKQYIYHPDWRLYRDTNKYNKVLAFGQALPLIRNSVNRHLELPGLPKEKVLATVVRLLESTHIRIGNEEYARENGSFGLTTMRVRHVKISANDLRFSFRGKSGVKHSISLNDRRLAKIIRKCQDLPGQELFQFIDDDGKRHGIDSNDVNQYLREITGIDLTAKDFRTWAGTLEVTRYLRSATYETAAEAKINIQAAIEVASKKLGNTKTVCRKSYVHPTVIEHYTAGTLFEFLDLPAGDASPNQKSNAFESNLLKFLEAALKPMDLEKAA